MAPLPPPTAVMLDTTEDFNPAPTKTKSAERTLLLCPPAVASDPALLEKHLSSLDRTSTDVQMLDRLALGLVTLPSSVYTSVRLLPSSTTPLTPLLLTQINTSMTPGARWTSPETGWIKDKLLFLIAGFMVEGEEVVKPNIGPQKTVALKPRKKEEGKKVEVVVPKKMGEKVGFVDLGDDLGDEELIDEDELMADESLATAAQMPPECQPRPGKRRRACKDCTCGLREELEQEEDSKRKEADEKLEAVKKKSAAGVKLDSSDLAELDFTVQGKPSSCGNCYLGDAFRCDGCPYVGLPAFKPGEQVQVGLMDDQL